MVRECRWMMVRGVAPLQQLYTGVRRERATSSTGVTGAAGTFRKIGALVAMKGHKLQINPLSGASGRGVAFLPRRIHDQKRLLPLLLATVLLPLLLWLVVRSTLVENILTENCNKFNESPKSCCRPSITNGTAAERCSNRRNDQDDDDKDDGEVEDEADHSNDSATDQRWRRWLRRGCFAQPPTIPSPPAGANRSSKVRPDYGVCGSSTDNAAGAPVPLNVASVGQQRSANRSKRFIIFDGGGVVKLVLGVSYPIKMAAKRRSLAYFYNLQLQYIPPPRPLYWWSLFNTTTFAARTNGVDDLLPRDRSRQFIYAAIEAALTREGLPGVPCLLRTICDIAVQPFHTDRYVEHDGIFQELLNEIFTPDLTNVKRRYLSARRAGHAGVDCAKMFNECPKDWNWLKRISHIV